MFDCGQCYYYVTDQDIGHEVGKAHGDVTRADIETAISATGLDIERDVRVLELRSRHTSAYFVSESALRGVGIEVPAWLETESHVSRIAKRAGSRNRDLP